MKNPWTTIPGILVLLAAAFVLIAHAMTAFHTGGIPAVIAAVPADWAALAAAAGGVGLLKAQQGPL